ncbi:MAG: hypothetical protein NTX14_00330 [Candidatus Nealsonbacteria bacterium]|nr:hypothetical protein [Candidatus Nealsonbacteria bacterium]
MEEKKGMTPEAAFKMIAENELFADLCRILLSGERTQTSGKPVAEEEVVIGELTPLEIALFCARNELIDSAKKMLEDIGGHQEPDCPACRSSQKIEAIDWLLWSSVEFRLKAHNKALGIRDGYKVVERSQKESGFSIGMIKFG